MKTIIKNVDKAAFCKEIVELSEKMKNCYFWKPNMNAAGRRKYERDNSLSGKFTLKGKKYEIEAITDCSCRNIYFRKNIVVDGVSKDLRAVKSALKILEG